MELLQENHNLSSVMLSISQEVKNTLAAKTSEVIVENQETWRHLSNIPQIKRLIEKNIQLYTENRQLKEGTAQIYTDNSNDLKNDLARLRKENVELQKNLRKLTVLEGNFYLLEKKLEQKSKIVEMQKKCLIKLRGDIKELKNPLTIETNLEENNISLQVEEIDNKTKTITSNDFLENESKSENTVLTNNIQIDQTNLQEEESEEESDEESEEESDESTDSTPDPMIEHWEREKRKLQELTNEYDIGDITGDDTLKLDSDEVDKNKDIAELNTNLNRNEGEEEEESKEDEEVEEDEDEEEDEEEEEVEEVVLKINNKKMKVYKSNLGNIYKILEDEEAGDLLGTLNEKGKFIAL